MLEIFFGVYGIMGIFIAIFSNNPVFVPIIGLQAVGFFYIAYMSLSHTRFKRNKSSTPQVLSKREKMANTVYKLSMIGILAIIVFGGFMAFYGYNTDIYPLDKIRGHLDGVVGSSDPEIIRNHLIAIQSNLDIVMANDRIPERINPEDELVSKNPVWLFSTESTNFVRIQSDVNTML